MQITETSADGLKREYKVVIPAQEIEAQVNSRLQELSRTVTAAGFRPGKVPLPIVKQRYAQSVMGEVLESAVNDSSQKAIDERGLRPALQPKIQVTSFEEGGNLEYDLAVELLPESSRSISPPSSWSESSPKWTTNKSMRLWTSVQEQP